MRITVASGSLSNGLAGLGAGLAVLFPDQRLIGGLIIAVAVFAALFDVKIESGRVEVGTPQTLGRRWHHMGPQFLILAGAIFILVGLGWQFWPKRAHPTPAVTKGAAVATNAPTLARGASLAHGEPAKLPRSIAPALSAGNPDTERETTQRTSPAASAPQRLPLVISMPGKRLEQAYDGVNGVITGLTVRFHDSGSETMEVRINKLSLSFGGKQYEVLASPSKYFTIYPADERLGQFSISFGPLFVPRGTPEIIVEIETQYDNAAPVGLRRMSERIRYSVNWTATDMVLGEDDVQEHRDF